MGDSHDHNQIAQPVSGPAAEPAYTPIAEPRADRDGSRQPGCKIVQPPDRLVCPGPESDSRTCQQRDITGELRNYKLRFANLLGHFLGGSA
jgi:hypothetical protein